ncbi:hypothetical protein [Clostridium sporogenes]|uniref:hypothetical protein n=1 Tax=Clostridium sporogenes TaxID=1509 RepID=UPI000717A795|nr:hypothetical protein [Clostridium sporogenes]KRU36875.1 hypothetical protein VT94_38340 [Clostridium sporogenes]MBY7063990.1 hypothetical protein [Clostridium sporogenes]MBY7069545.1 hypothetical protein [Clostridium sporogenes]MCW6063604.1 hypothetical protein [Clostridium sporogenes]OQP92748.1 hypothetical protein VT93_0212570 [Clostridium sporogenes]
MQQGYLIFEGIECVYSKLDNYIIIIPKDQEDIRKLYQNCTKTNFVLEYEHYIYKKSYVYIEKIIPRIDNTFCFLTKYNVNLIGDYEINGFIMTGDDIDVFFSPTSYFFHKKRSGKVLSTELLYDKEEVNNFKFNYNGIDISVSLYYGEMLNEGIRSDLMLHPKLDVKFDKTKDINFVFGVYSTIIKFLQIVRYQKNYNLKPVVIYGPTEKVEKSHLGELYSKPYNIKSYRKTSSSEYIYFEPFISQLLQLASDDIGFSIRHLPSEEDDLFKYDVIRYLSVFSAFEYECNKNADEYLNISDELVKNIKKDLQRKIREMKINSSNNEEKNFLSNAYARIAQLGTQYGQERKIINAYNKLEGIIKDSMSFLFPRGYKIKEVASNLTKLRGKIAHDNLYRDLTEDELRNIRFMDVICYILLLKRAGIDDCNIELIIGAVFQCNFKYME